MDVEKTEPLEARRVASFQVPDIEAYEKLMGLMAADENLPELLTRKTAEEYRDRDLAVWLNEDTSAPDEAPRLPLLNERWEAIGDEVNEMVRLVQGAKSATH